MFSYSFIYSFLISGVIEVSRKFNIKEKILKNI